jgi:hypothetical protein
MVQTASQTLCRCRRRIDSELHAKTCSIQRCAGDWNEVATATPIVTCDRPEPNAEATLTGRPNVFPIVAAEQPDTHSQSETTTAPPNPPKMPVKRHTIFPGKARQKTADEQPASWNESQWID